MQNLEQLYKEYFQTVYKFIFCMTHDSNLSEELTQETFYQALKTYKNFRGDCKVIVWLCQIAKHIWMKEYRQRNKFNHYPIEDFEHMMSAGIDLETEFILQESKCELFRRIKNLDEKSRNVMILRLTGDLSFREIGDLSNQTENWARVTFYRGKQKVLKEDWK